MNTQKGTVFTVFTAKEQNDMEIQALYGRSLFVTPKAFMVMWESRGEFGPVEYSTKKIPKRTIREIEVDPWITCPQANVIIRIFGGQFIRLVFESLEEAELVAQELKEDLRSKLELTSRLELAA